MNQKKGKKKVKEKSSSFTMLRKHILLHKKALIHTIKYFKHLNCTIKKKITSFCYWTASANILFLCYWKFWSDIVSSSLIVGFQTWPNSLQSGASQVCCLQRTIWTRLYTSMYKNIPNQLACVCYPAMLLQGTMWILDSVL